MLPARSLLRTWSLLVLFGAGACSGSMSCGGCAGLAPIPGGFDPSAQIEHAAQIRLSSHGLDFVEGSFASLVSAYSGMKCGGADDVPCPTGFVTVPGNQANPSTCDLLENVCVESRTGSPGPLLGFEIDQVSQSGATICRDDLTDPARRRCYAWLRLEGLTLAPTPPEQVVATVSAQIQSSDIPFRYDTLGMDCVVSINSGASGSALQDIVVTARVTEWTPPSGAGGRQLKVVVDSVDAQIPDGDIHIARDPVHGTLADAALCGLANLGIVKNALIPRLTGTLANVVNDQVAQALGMKCTGLPGECPAMTSCNADGLCAEDATGDIVPGRFGTEGRLDFSALLAGLTAGRPGQGDLSFLVGGQSGADATGLAVGLLGGAEVVTPDPSCAVVLPSPRLRPGWTPPPLLPAVDAVDLDFDGSPETSYMLAVGVSKAFLDQVMWTIYTTGLFCQSVSAYDVDLLNTGSLGLLVPSIAQLTHADRFRDSIYPARVAVHPGAEPVLTIGSGKVDGSGNLVEPLVRLTLRDLQVDFSALVEERWVRLMTLTADLDLGVGAIVTPSNEIQPVIGDLTNAISNVRVTNSEILAEDPAELAMAIPALLQVALPQLSGTALPGFALPTGADLGGFELDVVGIRGVESAPGVYPNLAVYANLGFDPSLVPHLELAVDTVAKLVEVRAPSAAAFSVAAPGGPSAPEVVLAVSGLAPAGAPLEAQVRVDGGAWTPFFPLASDTITVRRPELLVEGAHVVEVRAREVGRYRTLDPTPARVAVVVDVRPPQLSARLAPARGGAYVDAWDVVSKDQLRLELGVGGAWRAITPAADGFVAVPELESEPSARLAVRATDGAGHPSEVVLREASVPVEAAPAVAAAEGSGCTCVAREARGPSSFGAGALVLALGLFVARRHRRRA